MSEEGINSGVLSMPILMSVMGTPSQFLPELECSGNEVIVLSFLFLQVATFLTSERFPLSLQ